jgi:hypothetical protein
MDGRLLSPLSRGATRPGSTKLAMHAQRLVLLLGRSNGPIREARMTLALLPEDIQTVPNLAPPDLSTTCKGTLPNLERTPSF